MKVSKLAVLAMFSATALLAQQKPAAPAAAPAAQAQDEGQKVVAVVNGERITKAKLDALYERLGAQLRAQYESSGGKTAFLQNYVGKRLVLQEAIKRGFDKKPDVQLEIEAAKESALFDRYVRDNIATQYVTDEAVQKYYAENPAQFTLPERMHVRHIVIPAQSPDHKGEALNKITQVFGDLRPYVPKAGASANEIQVFANRFAEAARKNSQDGVAQEGGDLGWVSAESNLDPTFYTAMSNIPRGTMSGVVETKFGYHLIFVEDKQGAGVEPFENIRTTLREFLLTQAMSVYGAEVMGSLNRLTNELRTSSSVALYPENLK